MFVGAGLAPARAGHQGRPYADTAWVWRCRWGRGLPPPRRDNSFHRRLQSRRKSIRLHPSVYREPGRAYSVTIGTAPRRPVFANLNFGLQCVEELRRIRETTGARVYAFCLMPDHVHLLVGVPHGSSLPALIGAWKSQCYREWRRIGRRETFWQRSYFDHALREEEDLRVVTNYILNNPVRAGIVIRFQDYKLCGSLEFDL
jgi:REP-associated tyrosine transposase